ncbi:trehalose-phosphatase [Purpureocillium lavendulum]|uniref:Trehalose-phosphatase n=1 Tax=Purpureocillium lavendulum TaxID=1247861 RepID=A0AB34FR86_9HYPO|nr:trehalose-phosphatase [Purpureocillium lavendulum]
MEHRVQKLTDYPGPAMLDSAAADESARRGAGATAARGAAANDGQGRPSQSDDRPGPAACEASQGHQHHPDQQQPAQQPTPGPGTGEPSSLLRHQSTPDVNGNDNGIIDDIIDDNGNCGDTSAPHGTTAELQRPGSDSTAAKLAPSKLNAAASASAAAAAAHQQGQAPPFPASSSASSPIAVTGTPPPLIHAASSQGSAATTAPPRRMGLLDLRHQRHYPGQQQDHHDGQHHQHHWHHHNQLFQSLVLDAVTPGIHPATYVDPHASAPTTPWEWDETDGGSSSAASTPAATSPGAVSSSRSRPVVVGAQEQQQHQQQQQQQQRRDHHQPYGESHSGYFDLGLGSSLQAPRVGPGVSGSSSSNSVTGTEGAPAVEAPGPAPTGPRCRRGSICNHACACASASSPGVGAGSTTCTNRGGRGSTSLGVGGSVIPLTHHHRRPRAARRGAMARRQSLSEIRAANPDLALSGNIISATFNIPHALTYKKDGDWDLKPRRGQSALFDSFAYLSSDATPWNHHVVAWTGEIEDPHEPSPPPPESPAANTTVGASSLNALSAPVPVDAATRLPTPPAVDGLWIPREHQQRLEHLLARSQTIRTSPVWLADDADAPDAAAGVMLRDQARWRRYAQYDLYTLFHYKQHEPTDGRKERLHYADYFRMNKKFADRIIEVYKPGDVVVVHDYYLMLLPSMLRQRVPNMYISFFLHSPFPSSEFLRCLPRRKEVLEGVLGANLVGFQSYSYSRHFLSCCTRILGFPSDTLGIDAYGSRVQVGVFPIGIDAARVETAAWADSVEQKYRALKKMYHGKKIIVGRDRLDSARGVAQKLQAFERFLELYPEWRERVVLIQVTSPTSADAADPDEGADGGGSKLSSRVNELVMKINGDYGSLGFTPVHHYPQYLRQDEYFALLRAADIGLITSVRDGMNTTSLEYVVCQKQGHGPLILSEFSGTAGSLADAIHINPWDLSGVASEINTALTMPEDRRRAMQERLYRHVTTHNVQSWIDKFIRRVYTVLGEAGSAHATPLLDRALLLSQYRSAGKRLFMFDYDGTLTPIVREPSAAIPSERIITALKLLAADERNAVWIISGRDQEFLGHHLGHISRLGFSAEHGSFMRNPGSQEWVNLAEKFDMGWQAEVMDVFQKYTDKVQGSFIERKRCALTWHYRQADPELGAHMSRACHKELEAGVGSKWEVEVMPGKANIEVRPTFINKGEIAKRLIATYHNPDAQPTADDPNPGRVEFSLCMGDDFTDEDMFRALNGASGPVLRADHVFTVTVGASTKVTLAKWHLLEPEDVIDCVALLAGAEGPAGPERLGEVNLAALSMVEGKIPRSEL